MERDLGRYLGVHCALMNRTKEKKKKTSIIWKPAATDRVHCVLSIYRPHDDVIDSAYW